MFKSSYENGTQILLTANGFWAGLEARIGHW